MYQYAHTLLIKKTKSHFIAISLACTYCSWGMREKKRKKNTERSMNCFMKLYEIRQDSIMPRVETYKVDICTVSQTEKGRWWSYKSAV